MRAAAAGFGLLRAAAAPAQVLPGGGRRPLSARRDGSTTMAAGRTSSSSTASGGGGKALARSVRPMPIKVVCVSKANSLGASAFAAEWLDKLRYAAWRAPDASHRLLLDRMAAPAAVAMHTAVLHSRNLPTLPRNLLKPDTQPRQALLQRRGGHPQAQPPARTEHRGGKGGRGGQGAQRPLWGSREGWGARQLGRTVTHAPPISGLPAARPGLQCGRAQPRAAHARWPACPWTRWSRQLGRATAWCCWTSAAPRRAARILRG